VTWEAAVFLALVLNQLVATMTSVVTYRRESDWRRSAVGRHLMYWLIATGALDASWVLLLLVRWPWLIFVLFAVQAALGALGWQRVWLVWRAQHGRVRE
jgi:hypothetical protein